MRALEVRPADARFLCGCAAEVRSGGLQVRPAWTIFPVPRWDF